MSKQEDELFANMKNCVLLIIVYTNFILCSDLNISDDHTCPFTLFRRKREQPEYTRWRANLESTQEFIVKVLDDELTTTNPIKVIAINMQPHKKGGEKIIIGGVMVPKPTTMTSLPTSIPKDYTRFVPPTTVVTRNDGSLAIPPQSIPNIKQVVPIQPRGKHPQRDESPPAGPQFLPRTPPAAKQYVPITPVGFTHRTAMPPVTPPNNVYVLTPSNTKPSRTTPFVDVITPTATKSVYEELRRYQTFEKDAATRTAPASQVEPKRTSLELKPSLAKESEMLPTEKIYSVDDKETLEDNKTYHGEADAAYRMMFYNDDEESSSKKTEKESDESYEDKIKDQEMYENETDSTTESKNLLSKSSAQSILDYEEEDGIGNETSSSSANIQIEAKKTLKESLRGKRRPPCSMLKLRQLNFNSPRTLPEIVNQLSQWAENSPLVKWIDITNGNFTAMENPIYMMVVDDPSSGQIITAKQTVMIVAGIHGRDHHAVAAAMYILYQLIERSGSHTDLLNKFRFWIIPVFNPDGYDYSMTFPHRRGWIKNLRQRWDECKGKEACHSCKAYGIRCTIQPCYGVNLDRNFEYQWIPAEELKSEHPCGPLYAGSRQLSESETRALTNFLHEQRTPIYFFIALKEGGILGIMYPHSHTKNIRAHDNLYRLRATLAAKAATSISGRFYVAGQTSEFLPLYAGGIEDWVDSHLGIEKTYSIMMFRPSDTYNANIITERVVHEVYAAMDTLIMYKEDPKIVKLATARKLSTAAHSSNPTKPCYSCFIGIYFSFLYLNTFDT